MKSNLPKTIEKWILRLVVIQFIALVISQFIMSHQALSPYLNKAIRSEGVFDQEHTNTVQIIQQSPYLWYDENKKTSE